jgi:hypothetical protein
MWIGQGHCSNNLLVLTGVGDLLVSCDIIQNLHHLSNSMSERHTSFVRLAGGFYQNLVRMYDYLRVKYHEQPFLFSFMRLPAEASRRR